ncbi:uncharacterized protein LOC131073267 [Cryptomeria japonica]|uniref:uncharacterized protein LOC131073267 n=1 Tax=Cryptomeria japonica TaxID=3369 RepID=UPI0027DA7286|nr:uncharacterized protein LOC131073267 [Cryptomeria japonica]
MADLDASILQDVRDLANSKWGDPNDRRRIAACLVNIVYLLEMGKVREEMVRQWCNLLKFNVKEKIKEREVIFGAVFEWVGEKRRDGGTEELHFPLEVVAFRGTIPERNHILRKDIKAFWNAINAFHDSVERVGIGLN